MYTVWKYPIYANLELPNTQFILKMPKNAVILSVQMQNESPCVWAHVNSGNEMEERHFEIVGTGTEAPRPGEIKQFIGTYQTGPFVFHLFERGSYDD